MPFKDKQKQKEYFKQYHEKNREKKSKYNKEYNQTEQAKKMFKISDWKNKKEIKTDDYDFLYDWYMSIDNCLNCGIELIGGTGFGNHKHLDHDHKSKEPTMVVCGNCNVRVLK